MPKSFFEKLTSSIRPVKEEEPKMKPLLKRVDFKEEGEVKKKPEIKLPKPEEEEEFEETLEEKVAHEPSATPQEGQLTIDVYQTDTDIVIKSTIAGVKPDDLDINITNDMVTIRGNRAQDEKIPQENYFYQECYWGLFSRSIILPQDILPDRAQASMQNGVLVITLPKAHAVTTRKLKVRTTV